MNQLPTWFKPVLEYIELMEAYGFTMDGINGIAQQIYNNLFIQTADSATLTRWEDYFGLIVNYGDTLEYRRQRVLQKFEQTIPYTIWHLRAKLTELYGNEYSLTVDPEACTIRIIVTSNRYGAIDLLYDLIWAVVPAHLAISANQQVTNNVAGNQYIGAIASRCFIQDIKILTKVEKASGPIASFNNELSEPLVNVIADITAVQAGTGDPSPTNIREITGFDAANITVASENLLFGCETQTVNGVTATVNADGSWTLNGTCTASEFIILKSGIHLKAGRYTLKCVKTNDPVGDVGSGTRCQIYSNSKSIGLNVRWSNATDYTLSVNLPEANDYYLRIRIAANASYDNITMYPMLVLGDTAPSEFITAKGATYNISFGSAGAIYGGTLDVSSGVLTATAIGYAFDGTENWIRVGNENARIFRFVSPFQTVTTSPERACSHFPNASITTSTTHIGYLAYSSTGSVNTNMNFRPTNTEDMTLAQWKEWVAGQYANGTPLTAWYEPINPVTYQLDPVTIETLIGQNNVWSDTGDVTVFYKVKGDE